MIKRHFLKNLSIRNKIIAVVLFVSLTVLSVGAALIVRWDVNQLKADMQSKLILEAKLIGDTCVVPLTFEDRQQAQEALSRMQLIESVEAGVLFDREGKVFAWYPDSLDVSTFRGNKEDGPSASFRSGRFTIREPVRFKGSLLGGLVMAASSKPLESRKQKLAVTVLATVLALVLVSFILASRMQAIISGPIVRLNGHFGRIAAEQDYSVRVARPSNDETGSLYDGFNELLETIEGQNREKKKLIDDLRASRAMQNTIFDAVPQSIYWKDKNGVYLGCNMTFAESAGLDHPDLIAGKTDDDLPWKKEAEKTRADDREVLRSGTHKYHTIEKLLKADGNSVWMDKTKIPLFNSDGEVYAFLGVFEDITERKLAEEEIKKLNAQLEDRVARRTAQLEAANKELEAFSYSVSHDLRAPLRHASGYVDLLLKKFKSDLTEKGQHYLNAIADSVHQMGMLIDDLLQFSRTGRTEMRLLQADLSGIVQEVTEILRRENPGRIIEWTVGRLPSVFCDESLIKLVWMNLLSNAVKFTRTREKAAIIIEVRETDNEAVFSVADNGVGFDMKYAQKLFGVFQRLHSMAEFEGTGIGLANVRRIITRHDGRTWAEARPDEGATFYFSLPKQPKET